MPWIEVKQIRMNIFIFKIFIPTFLLSFSVVLREITLFFLFLVGFRVAIGAVIAYNFFSVCDL